MNSSHRLVSQLVVSSMKPSWFRVLLVLGCGDWKMACSCRWLITENIKEKIMPKLGLKQALPCNCPRTGLSGVDVKEPGDVL